MDTPWLRDKFSVDPICKAQYWQNAYFSACWKLTWSTSKYEFWDGVCQISLTRILTRTCIISVSIVKSLVISNHFMTGNVFCTPYSQDNSIFWICSYELRFQTWRFVILKIVSGQRKIKNSQKLRKNQGYQMRVPNMRNWNVTKYKNTYWKFILQKSCEGLS